MKKHIIPLCLTAVIFAAAVIVEKAFPGAPGFVPALAYFCAFAAGGARTFVRAVKGIIRGNVFSEDTLMITAAIGAFIIGEYPEAVFVVFFAGIGNAFEEYAAKKSKRSVSSLMEIVPNTAQLIEDGAIKTVDPEDIPAGSLISVAAGQRVPIDGVVESGSSFLDTSALTGESVPVEVAPGDTVLSGCINSEAALTVRTTKSFEDSAVSRILDLVETSTARKSRSERFITRFAKYYTPAVLGAALLVAVIPPLVIGPSKEVFLDYVYRALSLLVVSCPCALVISVPLAFFGGIGGAAKKGILIKGGVYLEALDRADTVVFDKTGTITKGTFSVSGVFPAEGFTKEELTELAACAEYTSMHPVARSVCAAYGKDPDPARLGAAREIPGRGMSVEVDGKTVLCGNAALLRENGVEPVVPSGSGCVTNVYVAVDGVFAGSVMISDELKPGAEKLISELSALGVKNTVMLTGDHEASADAVCARTGISRHYSSLLPADKVAKFEEIADDCKKRKTAAVYVGDGINDAPVLALSDAGIAMGALGSDAAIEAADIVIMNDDPLAVAQAKRTARKTMLIARENIVLSVAIKLIILALCAANVLGMKWAVFGDSGVMILAVLNAFRTLGKD